MLYLSIAFYVIIVVVSLTATLFQLIGIILEIIGGKNEKA
jgi:hypothetical protein